MSKTGKRFSRDNQIWLRNNLSTMISQLIDSIVFVLIAFYGVYETAVLFEIFITTYFLKWIVAAADTPFVYWGKNIFKNDKYLLD